jgi:hypothetical protein
MSPFRIGQHVVCIDDTNWSITLPGPNPIKGNVYTIDGLNSKDFPALALTLAEFEKIYVENGVITEGWYRADRFRPLQKLKVEDFLPAKAPRKTVDA